MKVFWSWQSDTPGRIGRHFVRDALRNAIVQLRAPPDIEEPERAEVREALHLDSDRQGIPGSPDLARTILEKIEASGIVVADVTPIGSVPRELDEDRQEVPGKKVMNPNVAIELGYALRAISDRNVLMVCNRHYGDREDLPFDLKHKAGPIFFALAPDADRQTIAREKQVLTATFIEALRPYLLATTSTHTDHVPATPATFSPAAYFAEGEVLAQVGVADVDQIDYVFETRRLCFLRIIPRHRLASPLAVAKLREVSMYAPMVVRGAHGAMTATNRFGAIRYEPGNNPRGGTGRLNASTQLFRNGELWAVNANMIVTERGGRPSHIPLPLLPLFPFEQGVCRALRDALAFMSERLELSPPWKVVLGVVGLETVHYGVNDDFLGPVHLPEIIHEANINAAGEPALESTLLPFFEMIHDASGYPRPRNLHGFPPAAGATGGNSGR